MAWGRYFLTGPAGGYGSMDRMAAEGWAAKLC